MAMGVPTMLAWRRLRLGAIALALAFLSAIVLTMPVMAQSPPDAPTGLTATPGDSGVALSWDDPANPSIRGYEYQVNHNDTSTGKLSGWGKWLSIEGSDSSTTSHIIDRLTNGREYRYRLRAVNAYGAGSAAPNSAPWFVSATPQAPEPTPTPTPEPTATPEPTPPPPVLDAARRADRIDGDGGRPKHRA